MEATPFMLLASLLMNLLWVLEIAIVARALMSWFDRSMSNPISQILVQITEPIIAPIRRIVPSAGMLDLSPMVAILLILVLQRMLSTALA
jgi:YggT family protein